MPVAQLMVTPPTRQSAVQGEGMGSTRAPDRPRACTPACRVEAPMAEAPATPHLTGHR